MLSKIVEHLYAYDDYNWHVINPFLKENFPNIELIEIRKALVKLVLANRIEIENNVQKILNGLGRINANDNVNGFLDLDTLPIKAKITHEEKERLQLLKDKTEFPPTIITGNTGTVISHSSVKDLISPLIQITKSISPNKPKKRSWVEIGYWVAGIIAGIILLYEFVLKHFL